MLRPTFLIAEPEPEHALSTRKLVLETAKYNVITAHSSQELREAIEVFPGCNAIIIHEHLLQDPAAMIKDVKRRLSNTPVILLSPNLGEMVGADYRLGSHDAQELLQLVRRLFGDPREIKAQRSSGSADAWTGPDRRRRSGT